MSEVDDEMIPYETLQTMLLDRLARVDALELTLRRVRAVTQVNGLTARQMRAHIRAEVAKAGPL